MKEILVVCLSEMKKISNFCGVLHPNQKMKKVFCILSKVFDISFMSLSKPPCVRWYPSLSMSSFFIESS